MDTPQGIEIASASEFHEFTSLGGSEAAISDQIFNFLNFQKTMLQSSSVAANSCFDLASAFESDVLGLEAKFTESSNEFTDFENFEVEEVARPKTRDAMQAVNPPGVGITLKTTALRVI